MAAADQFLLLSWDVLGLLRTEDTCKYVFFCSRLPTSCCFAIIKYVQAGHLRDEEMKGKFGNIGICTERG